MFDHYERSIAQIAASSLLISPLLQEQLLSFSAWAVLKGLPPDALSDNLWAYYEENLPGSGDAMQRILAMEEPQEKEAALRFLCLPDAFWKERESLSLPPPLHPESEATMRETLKDPALISRLIGIDVRDIPLNIHISPGAPRDIRMHYFMDLGVFLSVGADIDLSAYSAFSQEDLLKVFKALADASRLKILQALLHDSLTVTQLSDAVRLTLSTVTHHLKQLIEARLVNLAFSSKAGKGAQFEVNRLAASDLISLIQQRIS